MSWLVPFPLASASLLAFWLLLNQTLSLGHFLLGIVVALIGGWSLQRLQIPNARLRGLRAIGRLVVVVLIDIVRSNIAVASIIMGFGRTPLTSGFVEIPLELRNPYALATLACIITSTPGTLWVDFDAARGILTIHVLALTDESEWVRTIKGRYERPLLEIFA